MGTIQSTSNGDRNATVRVERIWLGPVLPATVEVQSGAQGSGVASSADRTWVLNETYLFVLADPEPPFTDEACSATTVYTERVAALEPDGAIEPEGRGGSGGPWLLVAAALLAAGVLQVRRAARRAQTLDSSEPRE